MQSPTANIIEIVGPTKASVRSGVMRLTREGLFWLLAAGVMFATGLFKGINLLILLAYLMLGLWTVNFLSVRRDLKSLRSRRLPYGTIFFGVPSEFQFELSTGARRPVRGVTVEDRSVQPHRWVILRLNREIAVRIRYWRRFEKRGRHSSGALYARSQFPFGLVGRTIELAPAEEFVILPRLGRLNVERLKHWLQKTARGDGRTRLRRPHRALQEAEIHGLRDFRLGDSPRWIHWRSTARRNQVLVCEFEDNSAPELVLMVEPYLGDAPSANDREKLECLISMAATIQMEWSRDRGNRMTLIIVGPEFAVAPSGTGWECNKHALELLAVREGGPAVPIEDWIDRLPQLKTSAPILVLTSRVKSPLAAEIAARLGQPAVSLTAGEPVDWYEPPAAISVS